MSNLALDDLLEAECIMLFLFEKEVIDKTEMTNWKNVSLGSKRMSFFTQRREGSQAYSTLDIYEVDGQNKTITCFSKKRIEILLSTTVYKLNDVEHCNL